MFIRNCLTPINQLTTIHPSESIADALKKLSTHLSLPCVDEKEQFVGIVSKRSVFEFFEQTGFSESFLQFSAQSVDKAILKDVSMLTLDAVFEDTIEIITRIPFVPIVEDGKFLGIVKRSDVQRALAITFATNVESDRLLLGVPEVEGTLERMFNITHRLGLSVVTCVPFDAGDNLNRRLLLKVAKTRKLTELVNQLERSGILVIQVN